MTYAVGDLHGCLNEWLQLRDKIQKKDSKAKFILIGDIIDRGSQVVELCDWAVKHITPNGKYQMIIGNHEHDKILDFNKGIAFLGEEKLSRWWDRYKYTEDDGYHSMQKFDTYEHYKTVINFFKTLPYYKKTRINNRKFILAHANIPWSAIDKTKKKLKNMDELTWDTKTNIVWDRCFSDFTKLPDTILVHGHTPTVFPEEAGPVGKVKAGKVYKQSHRYNIDCGLVYKKFYNKGNLAALCLNTLKVTYLYT